MKTNVRARRWRQTTDYINDLARMIRAAGKRVAEGDDTGLAELIRLHDAIDQAVIVGVAGLRSTGITWQSIGEATGTTKQAAIQKWARYVTT